MSRTCDAEPDPRTEEPPVPRPPTASNWFSILALGLIWGGTFMVVSIALRGYGPLTVAAARTSLGALALIGLAWSLGRPLPDFSARLGKYLIWIGLLSTALPFTLLSWGQQHVPSAFAGLSMAAVPLFVVPLANFTTDERWTWRSAVGVTLGFAGAAVLIGPGVLNLGGGAEPLAQLACIAAALSYAISSVMTLRCPPVDPIVLSAISLLVGAAALLPAMLVVEGVPGAASPDAMWAILFLGLVPTALAALLRVAVIQSAGSVFMTLVNYQVPVWSMIFGALVLSEALPLRFFAALALILTGIAVSQAPQVRRLLGRA